MSNLKYDERIIEGITLLCPHLDTPYGTRILNTFSGIKQILYCISVIYISEVTFLLLIFMRN